MNPQDYGSNAAAQAAGAKFMGWVSVTAGAIAALGTALVFFRISPGFVAQHPGEAGWDLAANHLMYFGPVVLVSWSTLAFAAPKRRFGAWTLLFSIVWFLGFCTIK